VSQARQRDDAALISGDCAAIWKRQVTGVTALVKVRTADCIGESSVAAVRWFNTSKRGLRRTAVTGSEVEMSGN
jgi:hypothetical protein